MKKILFISALAVSLCLSACSAPPANPKDTTDTTPTSSSVVESNPTTPTESTGADIEEPGYFPIPVEPADFSHLSGAGGWSTVLSINRDGTLTGRYSDSEMGSSGEGYPNGTIYICDFSGVITDIEKINEYSYKMRLFDVTTHKPTGTEWIKNDVRYIAADPVGIYDQENKKMCEDFILYLPDTPIDQVPEDFLIWWPYRYEQQTNPKTTLSCYGILNVATNDGFFYSE